MLETKRDSLRDPSAGAADAAAEQLAEGLAGDEAGRSACWPPEGCVSWVPWTGRSTPR